MKLLICLLLLAAGPTLDTKSNVKVKGCSVKYSKYEPDHAAEILTIRRKARRKVVNSQPIIFEEYINVATTETHVLFQYVYQGVAGEKRLPLDTDTVLYWRGSEKLPPTKPGFGSGIEWFEESCAWTLPISDYLDITDVGRFTVKTSRKKYTFSLSKHDKEAMRWVVWHWLPGGEEVLKKRYPRYAK